MDFWPALNSVVLVIIAAALSGIVTWIFALRSSAKEEAKLARERREKTAVLIEEKHLRLVADVAEVKEKLLLLTAQVVPFNTAFQQILISQLTHSHTPELDALMTKIGPPITLTEEEEARMYRLLNERQADMGEEISQEEREAALILPYVMHRARAEQLRLANTLQDRLAMVSMMDVAHASAFASTDTREANQ